MFCPSFEKYEVSQANRLRGGVDGEASDKLSRRLSARDPLLLASVEIWIGCRGRTNEDADDFTNGRYDKCSMNLRVRFYFGRT